jgi:hypothetical protein
MPSTFPSLNVLMRSTPSRCLGEVLGLGPWFYQVFGLHPLFSCTEEMLSTVASKLASGEYIRGQSHVAHRPQLGPLKDELSKMLLALLLLLTVTVADNTI